MVAHADAVLAHGNAILPHNNAALHVNDDNEYWSSDDSSHTTASACDDGRATPSIDRRERRRAGIRRLQGRAAAFHAAALVKAGGSRKVHAIEDLVGVAVVNDLKISF